MADRNYKIVPLDVDEKTTQQKITELRTYLGANVAIRIEDGELDKAALFQQHLDLLELLVEHSCDRI